MQYKAIVTDLDRTLLRTDKTISARTVSVLHKAKEQGIYVIAATARPKRTMQEYDDVIGFDAVVCLNGAESSVGNEVISNFIPKSMGEAFLEKVCPKGEFVISAEVDGKLYANTVFPEWESIYYTDFPRLPNGNIHKIIISYSEDALKTIDECLSEELYRSVANNILIQIMHKTATKWNGISHALARLGVLPEESVYFGDDDDDIEPIIRCGLGVAVENGIEKVRDVADIVIASNDEDGVAGFISEKLLSF